MAFHSLLAQTGQIKGNILDSKTLEPLAFANVFINNTTLGTASDENGSFTLSHLPNGTVEVVFSFVGYQPYQTKITLLDDQEFEIKVKLIQDEKMLESVNVKETRDVNWEKQLKRFAKIFLGANKGTSDCKILNPWVLEFKEDYGALWAEATVPLEIENELLGYKLSYFLTRFREKAGTYEILGAVRFEEMQTFDLNLNSKWTRNRLKAYRGSQRHLFNSILNHSIRDEGFSLYVDKSGYENSPRSSVFAAELGKSIERFDTTKILIIPEVLSQASLLKLAKKIEVHYTKGTKRLRSYDDINNPVSWIELKNGTIKVSSNGTVLDLNNIATSGDMSTLRVAEMLPYNYQPGERRDLKPPGYLSQSAMADLVEQVIITTDKPYYYRGDILWFKGAMQYRNPEKLDTLSKLLYVELIDSAGSIIQSKNYFIDSGRVAGDFYFNSNMKAGDYYLRAYTNWMRNFGSQFFFVKPLKLLSLYDEVTRPVTTNKDTVRNKIIITSDKEVYKTREKVSIIVQIKNENGEFEFSNGLTVVVSDTEQVFPISGQVTDRKQKPSESLNVVNPNYPIEYGISLAGVFQNNKGRIEKSRMTLIQGNRESMTAFETDDQGRFWVSGFYFNDSVEFALQAKNKKGKVYGKVEFIPQNPPKVDDLPEPLRLQLQTAAELQHNKMDYDFLSDGKLLNEVTVTAAPLNYIKQDNTVQKERIEAKNFGRLFTTLQGKIPGLEVDTYMISNANSAYSWRIGYRSRNKEPLLMVDGLPYTGNEPVARELTRIDPASIDHVDLLRYNSTVKFGGKGGEAVVIAVYTKKGNSDGDPVVSGSFDKKYFQILKVKGYSTPLKFKSPDYDNKDEDHSQPDFRSTLYWNPNLIFDKEGRTEVSFYAADLPTFYRVIVQGTSLSGEIFSGEHIIEIR